MARKKGTFKAKCPVEEKPQIQCPECGKVFKLRSSLIVHLNKHKGKKYKCDLCQKTYTASYSLVIHKRTHSGLKPYRCKICGASFTNSGHRLRHEKTHSAGGQRSLQLLGTEIQKNKHQRLNKKQQLKQDGISSSQVHVCKVCHKIFGSARTLRVHRYVHQGRSYQCDTCDKFYTSPHVLKQHKLIHDDLRPFNCDTCGASFRWRTNLVRHIKIHTGEKIAMCDQCGKSFLDSCALKLHQQHCHMTSSEVTCHICGRTLKHKVYLKAHLKTHNVQKEFKCSQCGREFIHKHAYLTHCTRHSAADGTVQKKGFFRSPNVFCSLCDKGFVNKQSLNKHLKRHKDGSLKRWSKAVKTADSLRQHSAVSRGNDKDVNGQRNILFDTLSAKVDSQVSVNSVIKVQKTIADLNDEVNADCSSAGLKDKETTSPVWLAREDSAGSNKTEQQINKTIIDSESLSHEVENINTYHPEDDTDNVVGVSDLLIDFDCENENTADIKSVAPSSRMDVEKKKRAKSDFVENNTIVKGETYCELENTSHCKITSSITQSTHGSRIDSKSCRYTEMKELGWRKQANSRKMVPVTVQKQVDSTSQTSSHSQCEILPHSDQVCRVIHTPYSTVQQVLTNNPRLKETKFKTRPATVINKECEQEYKCEKASNLTSDNNLMSLVDKTATSNGGQGDRRCQFCQSVFTKWMALRVHIRKHHPEKLKRVLRRCRVEFCGYSTFSSLDYARHQFAHRKSDTADNPRLTGSQHVSSPQITSQQAGPQHVTKEYDSQRVSISQIILQEVRRQQLNTDCRTQHASSQGTGNHSGTMKAATLLVPKKIGTQQIVKEAGFNQEFNDTGSRVMVHDKGSRHVKIGAENEGLISLSDQQQTNRCVAKNSDQDRNICTVGRVSNNNEKNVCKHEHSVCSQDSLPASVTSKKDENLSGSSLHGNVSISKNYDKTSDVYSKRCQDAYQSEEYSDCFDKIDQSPNQSNNNTISEGSSNTIVKSVTMSTQIIEQDNCTAVDEHVSSVKIASTGAEHNKNLSSSGKVCAFVTTEGNDGIHCTDCAEKFTTIKARNKHLQKHHKKKSYVCPVCDKTFRARSGLYRHRLQHVDNSSEVHAVRKFMCSICGACLTTAYSLSIHTRLHTAAQPYNCDTCAKTFSQRSHLTRHKVSQHQGVRRFFCDVSGCGKKFRDNEALTIHLRTHTGEKPFQCDICQKRFVQSQALNKHRYIHFDIRSFICNHCNQTFTTKNSLTRHLARHEVAAKLDPQSETYDPTVKGATRQAEVKKMAEKVENCDLCRRRFTTKRALLAHKRKACKVKVDGHSGHNQFSTVNNPDPSYFSSDAKLTIDLGAQYIPHKPTDTDNNGPVHDILAQSVNTSIFENSDLMNRSFNVNMEPTVLARLREMTSCETANSSHVPENVNVVTKAAEVNNAIMITQISSESSIR